MEENQPSFEREEKLEGVELPPLHDGKQMAASNTTQTPTDEKYKPSLDDSEHDPEVISKYKKSVKEDNKRRARSPFGGSRGPFGDVSTWFREFLEVVDFSGDGKLSILDFLYLPLKLFKCFEVLFGVTYGLIPWGAITFWLLSFIGLTLWLRYTFLITEHLDNFGVNFDQYLAYVTIVYWVVISLNSLIILHGFMAGIKTVFRDMNDDEHPNAHLDRDDEVPFCVRVCPFLSQCHCPKFVRICLCCYVNSEDNPYPEDRRFLCCFPIWCLSCTIDCCGCCVRTSFQVFLAIFGTSFLIATWFAFYGKSVVGAVLAALFYSLDQTCEEAINQAVSLGLQNATVIQEWYDGSGARVFLDTISTSPFFFGGVNKKAQEQIDFAAEVSRSYEQALRYWCSLFEQASIDARFLAIGGGMVMIGQALLLIWHTKYFTVWWYENKLIQQRAKLTLDPDVPFIDPNFTKTLQPDDVAWSVLEKKPDNFIVQERFRPPITPPLSPGQEQFILTLFHSKS
ncbi:hypothetical protein AAMO2058_000387000 [Amorphochlora amoebiformis]